VGRALRCRPLKPAFDIGPKPSLSSPRTLHRKSARYDPTVNGAAVSAGNLLRFVRAKHWVDSAYALHERTCTNFDFFWSPSAPSLGPRRREGQLKLVAYGGRT
jgi:hypothetical protein